MKRRPAIGGFVLAAALVACSARSAQPAQRIEPAASTQALQPTLAAGPDAATRQAASALRTRDGNAGRSLYQLHITLTDQAGKTLPLDAFRGHPVIVSMFYASCKAMCPLLLSHLRAIDKALSAQARAQTRFLLVSFDPERDTPAALTKLAVDHAIDGARWSLTSTAPSSVQELAAALDVRYRRLPTGEIAHASIITLLDAEGVPLTRVEDSAAEPAQLAQQAQEALVER